eukprot:5604116-Pleurochrysis_carterae.AAC.5
MVQMRWCWCNGADAEAPLRGARLRRGLVQLLLEPTLHIGLLSAERLEARRLHGQLACAPSSPVACFFLMDSTSKWRACVRPDRAACACGDTAIRVGVCFECELQQGYVCGHLRIQACEPSSRRGKTSKNDVTAIGKGARYVRRGSPAPPRRACALRRPFGAVQTSARREDELLSGLDDDCPGKREELVCSFA